MKNAAKITESKKGNMTLYIVTYRNAVVGSYLNRSVAVKAANEKENWSSTGFTHI